MSTTENNKLIAEFMELNKIVETNGIVFKDNNTEKFHEIKYQSDWNWLMPLVEKIEDLGYGVCISTLTVRISHADIQTPEETKIKSVYKAVIEFIQWYNQQKQ